MSNEIDEIVQFDQEEQKSATNNEAAAADLQINVAPQDYTDVALNKQSLSIDHQSFLTDTQQ